MIRYSPSRNRIRITTRLCYDSSMGANSLKTKTNDLAVRSSLIKQLGILHKDSRVLEEFSVARGKARADVVAVNTRQIHAFEIKSDLDNLNRLPLQQKYYSTVFSTVTLVVGMEHIVEAIGMVPDWWGITVAVKSGKNVKLTQIREAKQNRNLCGESISHVLNKKEIIGILKQQDPSRNYSNLSKPKLVNMAKSKIFDSEVAREFPRTILARNQKLLAHA